MNMAVPWTGARRIAVVPVWNQLVDARPDDDFGYQVASRVFYDPQGPDGIDDSLQNYIQAVSYGQASIGGSVFPTVRSPGADVTGAAMDSLPSGHGYTHLLAVLPHAFGAHRGAWAWWDIDPRNGITAFARVALFEDPSQTRRQSTGVWAMETLHSVTEFGDLYNVSPSMGAYDVMANAGASSHPCAHTKSAMGWVSSANIARHQSGTRTYELHAIGLRQPPPPGRVTAVRIPARSGTRSFLVEARLEVDQYERRDVSGDGIPGEGVIVYEVASLLDVRLRTGIALGAGQRYDNSAEGFSVSVTGAVPGGRRVSISRAEDAQCEEIREQIDLLLDMIRDERDIEERKRLLMALGQLRQRARALGCGSS
jgi:hypothetical protein